MKYKFFKSYREFHNALKRDRENGTSTVGLFERFDDESEWQFYGLIEDEKQLSAANWYNGIYGYKVFTSLKKYADYLKEKIQLDTRENEEKEIDGVTLHRLVEEYVKRVGRIPSSKALVVDEDTDKFFFVKKRSHEFSTPERHQRAALIIDDNDNDE